MWFFGVAGASTAALVIAGRAVRRLIPLSVLLKLSLMFPDRAPGRFRLALRAGSTRRLLARSGGTGRPPDSAAAETVLTLVAALAAHDRMTRGHCERVRAFNDLLAEELELAPYDRDRLRWAALLHDVGKIGVPARTLCKPEKLTAAEWAQVQRHPAYGAELTAGLSEWLGPWAASIPHHHERWDGDGYPNGLAGEEICMGGRVIAVADAFEVMTTRRPYSRPISAAAARAELARCAGTQFDPRVVRAFMNISLGKLHRAIGPVAWLAELPLIGAAPQLGNIAAVAGRAAAVPRPVEAPPSVRAQPATVPVELAVPRGPSHAPPPAVAALGTPSGTLPIAPAVAPPALPATDGRQPVTPIVAAAAAAPAAPASVAAAVPAAGALQPQVHAISEQVDGAVGAVTSAPVRRAVGAATGTLGAVASGVAGNQGD